MNAQIIPMHKSASVDVVSDPRRIFLEYLNNLMDRLERDDSMDTLEDITKALFNNRSNLLGQLTLSLIEKKFSFYLDQQYCDCPVCGKSLKASAKKVKRKIETLVGSFDLHRPYFYCRECRKGHYPLDEALGLAESSKQYDIQDMEAWLSSELPYETAGETYLRFTGENLSAHHMHETTNRIAGHLTLLDVSPNKEDIKEQIVRLSKGKFRRPVMMLGIDGAHAPTRPEPSPRKGRRGKGEWREVKGFRLYLIDSKRIVHLISWHQIQDDKELGQALAIIKEAGFIPDKEVRLCVIGDGASWIWNRVHEIFPQAKEVLDFYHCSEYLHELADAQYGKGSQKAREWVEATFTRLFDNRIDDVIKGIRRMKPCTSEANAKIQATHRYLSSRKEMVDYGASRRGGYHIGSGAIESSNKFISNVRLKRSGAWWYPTHANNILKIRCAKYNGTYDKIIKEFVEHDRKEIKMKDGKAGDHDG